MCGPELSDLQDMHEALGPLGVKVYALNVPAFDENSQTLEKFKQQWGLTYPVLNHSGTFYKLDFVGANTYPYPRDAIIGPDGVIAYLSTDYDGQQMWSIVTKMLEELEADADAP